MKNCLYWIFANVTLLLQAEIMEMQKNQVPKYTLNLSLFGEVIFST